jgi:hypothetical protein
MLRQRISEKRLGLTEPACCAGTTPTAVTTNAPATNTSVRIRIGTW